MSESYESTLQEQIEILRSTHLKVGRVPDLLARLFACQTFARLLKYICCYEQPKCFNLDAIRCYLLVCCRNERKKIAVL